MSDPENDPQPADPDATEAIGESDRIEATKDGESPFETGTPHSSTGLDTKLAGLLCYAFGFVSGAVFLIVEQKDRDVRFHAYQSAITFGALFALGFVAPAMPFFGWLVSLLVAPCALILWIFLMWQAFQGERYKLPVVGEWAQEQAEGH